MFRRNQYIPTLDKLLQTKLQYLGDRSSLLSIGMLRGIYMLTTINLKKARDKQPIKKTKDPPKIQNQRPCASKELQETNFGYKIYAQFSCMQGL